MKTSFGIIFGFILLLIANYFLAEEKVRHEHIMTDCQYGQCEMCLTEQKQVTWNGEHWETRQSKLYFE